MLLKQNFGKPIADLQLTQPKLTDMSVGQAAFR